MGRDADNPVFFAPYPHDTLESNQWVGEKFSRIVLARFVLGLDFNGLYLGWGGS